jgi:hypothetical protein
LPIEKCYAETERTSWGGNYWARAPHGAGRLCRRHSRYGADRRRGDAAEWDGEDAGLATATPQRVRAGRATLRITDAGGKERLPAGLERDEDLDDDE